MEKRDVHYDILATDLDGTLTNGRKEITERTKRAVRRAQEAGMHIVLASGRPYAGCRPVAQALELDRTGGYILAFNGGQIIDCRSEKVLYSKEVDRSFLPELFETGRRFGVTALTYEDNMVLSEDSSDIYVQKECFINRIGAKQVGSLTNYVTWPVPKCMLVGEHEKLLPARDYLAERFQEALSIYFSEPFFLEIMAEGIDKARSMEVLVQMLGTDRSRVIACGDGLNDISMIRYAGCGVAMANACAEVREAADCQAPSNEEDGVARFLEHLLAGNG